MLQAFRRFTKSKAGIVVTFLVLGLIALAFAAGDVTGLRPSGGTLGGSVASVGGTKIGEAEVRARVREEIEAARRQQPDIDAAKFVAAGGVESTLGRIVNSLAVEMFGKDAGMAVSRALVGSELQSIPALQNATGKFDQTTYENMLRQRGLTDAQVQSDIARQQMAQFLLVPTVGASQVPQQLATPYANLLLERRAGRIGMIPTAAVPQGAAPTDAEIQQFYARNGARYTVPERRVARYARVSADRVAAEATPTEAEIAKAYRDAGKRFAASEKRTVTQVTVLDQTAANALAAKVKGGASLAEAARAAGLEPRTLTGLDRGAYAAQTSSALADQVFGAPQGGLIGPVRGSIGFVVARVEGVEAVAARPLAAVRDELTAEIRKTKTIAALGRIQNALDDAINDNANFGELVADQKLTPATTGALTAAAADPLRPDAQPDATLVPVMQAAFAAEEGDTPTIVSTGDDGSFAVVGLERIVRAAPRPLTEIREQVSKDFVADRAQKAARRLANEALAKVNKGTPLATALSQSGVRTPPVQPIAAPRAQLASDPRGASPPLALLFSMAKGSAKLLEAPRGEGWMIVQLDEVTPGDVAKQPGVIQATRGDLARSIGAEYAQQFTAAIRNAVGVKQDAAALAKTKADITGQGAAN